ncbi:MAG: glycosyltransferase [Spirochaetales bacterium]|nr:glycosyltransferase [Spirochaetales bacterium]
MKEQIAFLYMNTGGGHIAPARALEKEINRLFPDDCGTVLHHGFSERMKASRFFFEDGYRLTTNYFESGYVLFYRMTAWPIAIHFGNYLISVHGITDLIRFFRSNNITKVVCLHEVLILITRAALDAVDPSIPLITAVTDPYTAHGLWFYEKRNNLVVFSEKLRTEAIEKHGFPEDRLHVFPFILSRKFDQPYTEEEKSLARERLGFPQDGKILLVAGGGEGLKKADRLVSRFADDERSETLVVVCGKNSILRRRVEAIAESKRAKNIRVYGFVPFMCDLVNIADCVITKGGASTVMEVLAAKKPVIFSTFIRGQEWGNVLFAVNSGAGWHLTKPRQILDKAYEILEDSSLREKIRSRIDRLALRNGLEEVARFIHSFKKG